MYDWNFIERIRWNRDTPLIINSSIQALIVDTAFHYSEAATRRVLWKKVFLDILQNSFVAWFSSPEACNFIEKETLAQVFPCEFCEIFKNTCFEKHLRTTASDYFEISQWNIQGQVILK